MPGICLHSPLNKRRRCRMVMRNKLLLLLPAMCFERSDSVSQAAGIDAELHDAAVASIVLSGAIQVCMNSSESG